MTDDDVPLVLNVAIADASIAEGAGAAATMATVTRSDPRGNLTVTLTSDDTSEATVPAQVTLLDGQSSTTFEIAAVDDSDVDGTQTVTFSAAATDYAGDSATLEVTDDDVPLVLSLSIADQAIVENAGGGATSATVTRSDPRGDLTVTLTSDDTSEATVPSTVTILDGQSSTTFEIAAVDDSLIDGTQNVTIAASAAGYAGASSSLSVTDEDVPLVLSLSIADQAIVENAGGGATSATVTRSDPRGDLTVTLTSDDTSEATVPSTVTILDGQSSTTFEIAAVDDSLIDGTQNVTIAASAAGYAGASSSLSVTDDDVIVIEVVDNQDSGFTQSGFREQNNAQVSAAYGGDNYNMRGGSGTASWTFSDLEDGEYQVAATWAHKYNNKYNVLDAPFSIEDGSGTTLATATVNQSIAPSDFTYGGSSWEALSTVNVTDGSLVVTLGPGSNGNKYTVADAIRIERIGSISPTLTVSVNDATVSETAGSAATTATVIRTDTSGDLVVTLLSDDTSEATVPSTVTILDGQSSATFEIAAVDDSMADGTQTATIAASASGYVGGSDTLDVTDDEVSLVTILDNQDSGFTQSGFREQNNAQVSAAYGGDNYNMRGGSGTASWTFSDLEDGEYQVAATWAHKYNNKYNVLDAPFSIEDGSGTTLATATVNQSIAPSDFTYGGSSWEALSTVNVTDGSLVVTLGPGSNGNKYTVADAIRIERIGSIDTASELELVDMIFREF